MADEEKKAAEEGKSGAETPQSKTRKRRRKPADEKEKKGGGVVTKVIATVFGAVVAPILVAVGVQWVKDRPAAAPTEPSHAPQTDRPPGDPVRLVTPNLNDHFYAFQPPDQKEEVDPEECSYEENPARIVLHESKRGSVLITKESFSNYTLDFWFRWREKQVPGGKALTRRASLGLHLAGTGAFFRRFPESIGVHLGEGETGTLSLLAAPNKIRCRARVKESPDRLRRVYVGGDAPEVSLASPEAGGWSGFILRKGFPAGVNRLWAAPPRLAGIPAFDLPWECQNVLWRDLKGFGLGGLPCPAGWHPAGDPTLKPPPAEGYKPLQWNRLQIECTQDTLTVTVGTGNKDEVLVNELTGLNWTKGKISIAYQGSEFEIQRMNIHKHEAEDKQPEKHRP